MDSEPVTFLEKNAEQPKMRVDQHSTLCPFLRHGSFYFIFFSILSGCSLIGNNEIFEPSFWESEASQSNIETDLGLAKLFKGEEAAAEKHFSKALAEDPNDVYALIGGGVLYQNSGQTTRARAMFEAVRALKPAESDRAMVWNSASILPLSEIASLYLDGAESRQAEKSTAAHDAVAAGGRYVSRGRKSVQGNGIDQSTTDADASESQVDPNVLSRFVTLRALRDDGLITPDEYRVRRQANLGALLPYSSSPPAMGLERPVPETDAIVGRLRTIGRAVEVTAMTVGQHASERTIILEALMPAKPIVTSEPRPLPSDLIAAADALRNVESLKAQGLVSEKEYQQERSAIESALKFPGAVSQNTVGAPTSISSMAGEPVTLSSRGEKSGRAQEPVLHLASFRSRQEAERGWSEIRQAHRALLSDFDAKITEVDLGPNKGRYFRVYAGPIESASLAEKLCRALEKERQYCEAMTLDVS